MRLTSMFSAAVVGMYFAACNADFDQSKVLINGSPALSNDATDRRLLRAHRVDAATAEERAPPLPNLSFVGITSKKKAMALADSLVDNEKWAKAAYYLWHYNGHTLDDVDKFLKLASSKAGKNYDQLYNGYVIHADYV
ncbi:Avirulence protein [Phytophthora megakarya]|uniref:RxLR effector protein n=1 Tax=Phytophthora megakarya TaxID=4795 RepID=A0A225V8B2_9STRA|nr:Avirulence protein [Phytophthora megakarya]